MEVHVQAEGRGGRIHELVNLPVEGTGAHTIGGLAEGRERDESLDGVLKVVFVVNLEETLQAGGQLRVEAPAVCKRSEMNPEARKKLLCNPMRTKGHTTIRLGLCDLGDGHSDELRVVLDRYRKERMTKADEKETDVRWSVRRDL